jgi:hypothetical protein
MVLIESIESGSQVGWQKLTTDNFLCRLSLVYLPMWL